MDIVTLHGVEASKKDAVKAEMLKLGAPVIRCVVVNDLLYAVEGTHRLAAAHELGLVPVIEDVTGQSLVIQNRGEDVLMSSDEIEEWVTTVTPGQQILVFKEV